MHPVELLGHQARLVALQRADAMPFEPAAQVGQRGDLVQAFLHVVLAEGRLARGLGLAQPPSGKVFETASSRTAPASPPDVGAGHLDPRAAHLLELVANRRHNLPNSYQNVTDFNLTSNAQRSRPSDITQLLAFSVKNKASDLHLSAGLPPMIRVHGDVRRINVDLLDHKAVHAMVYDIMSDTHPKHYEEFLEVDFSFEIDGLARFRKECLQPQARGAAAVFPDHPVQDPHAGAAQRAQALSATSHSSRAAWCW